MLTICYEALCCGQEPSDDNPSELVFSGQADLLLTISDHNRISVKNLALTSDYIQHSKFKWLGPKDS